MSLSSLQLDAFAEVARHGNFSEAASRLAITQSALSQRILNLESEIGANLFIREPAGARLTETGERLLRYCQAREALETEFIESFKSKDPKQLAGLVRIGGFSTVIRSIAIPALRELLAANLRVQTELMTREMRELLPLLITGQADYIFIDHPPDRQGVTSILVGHESNVLVKAKGRKSPDVYLDHDENDRTTDAFFKQQGQSPKPIQRAYFDEIYTIVDGVTAGLGKAVIPLHIARQTPGLEIVRGLKPLRTPVYFCFYEQAFYTKLQTAVIDTINEKAPKLL